MKRLAIIFAIIAAMLPLGMPGSASAQGTPAACPDMSYYTLMPQEIISFPINANQYVLVGQDSYGIINTNGIELPQLPTTRPFYPADGTQFENTASLMRSMGICVETIPENTPLPATEIPAPTATPLPAGPNGCPTYRFSEGGTVDNRLPAGGTEKTVTVVEGGPFSVVVDLGTSWYETTLIDTLTIPIGAYVEFGGTGTVEVCDEIDYGCQVLRDGQFPYYAGGASYFIRDNIPDWADYLKYDVRTSTNIMNLYNLVDGYFYPPEFNLSTRRYGVFQRPIDGDWSINIGDGRVSSGLATVYFEACQHDPGPYNPVNPPTPTPTLAPANQTATAASVPTPMATRTPTASPIGTNTPTASTTASPTTTRPPTLTPTPAAPRPPLSCPVADSVNIPVAPGAVPVRLASGVEFGVSGAAVWINIGAESRELPIGVYRWDRATGDYVAFSLTTPATLWICASPTSPTATATGSPVATMTPRPLDDLCVEVATPPPAQTGQLPSLVLIIPTLDPLPSWTPGPTITASLIISPAETLVAVVMAPALTAAAWSSDTFGPDGYERAADDAAPVVTGVAISFGWLAVLGEIGPLAWLLPPLVITVLVRVGKPILSIVKYIKQLIPFN